MPFVYDFSKSIDKIHTIEVSPKGWRTPIVIEYIVCQAHEYDTTLSIAWRVKGTTHTFTISQNHLNNLCNGKSYKPHFELALERFREDYLSWFTEEEYEKAEWKWEYEKEFGRYIIPDDKNNTGEN